MLQELVSSFRSQITESEKTETNKPFANSCQAGVALGTNQKCFNFKTQSI